MRQCGILAAAGLVALETIVPRLDGDHERTKRIADGKLYLKKIKNKKSIKTSKKDIYLFICTHK